METVTNNLASEKCLTIALLGVPNAGKSTLINKIVGENLAAVHHKPQMTRRNLLGFHTRGNVQLIFIDTPGLHQSENKLNQLMLKSLNESIDESDCVCVLLEVDQDVPAFVDEYIQRALRKKKGVVVINKTDKAEKEWKIDPETILNKYKTPVYQISALTGAGVSELISYLENNAVPHPFYYDADDLTTAHYRELVGEYIREQVMEYLHQEIPYQIGVIVESYKEKMGHVSISAMIVVNKESQKSVVIGKKGTTIDRIRKASIQKIRALTECRVTLSLFVKVDKNWIKNDEKIREYF